MSFNSPFGNQDQDANKAPFNPATPPQVAPQPPAYGSAPKPPAYGSAPKPPAYGSATSPAPEFGNNPYTTPAHTGGVQPTGKNSTMSVIGFVCAILFPLIGLILSILAWKQAGETGDNRGLAKAGIIVASILMALNIILSFAIIGGGMATSGG